MEMSHFWKVFFSVCICVCVNAAETRESRWKQDNAVLKLEHVITGIDVLTLREADFVLDGGSLSFGFSQRPGWPIEVVVFLPNPHECAAADGKQTIVVSSHRHLARFAVATEGDELYTRFKKLVEKSIVDPTTAKGQVGDLPKALRTIQGVVGERAVPAVWGAEAILDDDQ